MVHLDVLTILLIFPDGGCTGRKAPSAATAQNRAGMQAALLSTNSVVSAIETKEQKGEQKKEERKKRTTKRRQSKGTRQERRKIDPIGRWQASKKSSNKKVLTCVA